MTIDGTVIEHNQAREGGGALFYVSNDRTGTLAIRDSTLPDNPSEGFSTAGSPASSMSDRATRWCSASLYPRLRG